MFLGKKKNRSETTSVVIVDKDGGKKQGQLITPNRIKLPDGSLVTKYSSSTTGVATLRINQNGKIFKIRIE